jgi:hypothetical protein
MRLVHHHRSIPSLPHMAGPSVACIQPRRIAPVGIGHRQPQTVTAGGHDQQMDMVRHQAPTPDFTPRLRRRGAQLIEVEAVVAIGEKHLLTPVAALGDMMGKPWNDNAGETGHEFG